MSDPKDPKICIYVQKDILQPLKWMLKEFNKELKVVSFNSAENFETALGSEEWDMLILDSTFSQESINTYMEQIKGKRPELKTILIVQPDESKEEIIAVIRKKLVQGLVIIPFTGEVLCRYLDVRLKAPEEKDPPTGKPKQP